MLLSDQLHAQAGTLPWEWGLGLRNLTALSLGETALSGTLPASWAGLSNLSFFLAEATQLWGQVTCIYVLLCTALHSEHRHVARPSGLSTTSRHLLAELSPCLLANNVACAGACSLGRNAEPENGESGGQQRAQPLALVLESEVRGPLLGHHSAGVPSHLQQASQALHQASAVMAARLCLQQQTEARADTWRCIQVLCL